MPRITTRYDWPVDDGPASQGFAESGDVSRRIKVRIQPQSTSRALEMPTVSHTEAPAPGAHLACVLRRDLHEALSSSFEFVRQEVSELGERPTAELAVETLPLLPVLPDAQILQGQNIEVHTRYALRNAMVRIRPEPSLSHPQAAQMPLGRASACGLKAPHVVCVAATNGSHGLGVEELARAEHGGIHDTPVHPDDLWVLDSSRRNIGEVHYQVCAEYPVVVANPERNNLSIPVLVEVPRHLQRYLEPATNRGQGERPALQERLEGALVETGRTSIFLFWQSRQFLALEHVGGAVASALNERRLECGPPLASLVIAEGLEFAL